MSGNNYNLYGDENDFKLKTSPDVAPQGINSDSGGMEMAGIASGNPYVAGGSVALNALAAHKKLKARERAERAAAQSGVTSRMSSALSQLTSLGKALKL